MSLLVKVCGLTRADDAAFAAGQGADLLGFVCHPPSPRHCPDLAVAEAHLDRAVLVQVAEEAEAILAQVQRHGFRWVQPHLPVGRRAEAFRRFRAEGLRVLLPWSDEAGQETLPADLCLWEPSPKATGLAGGSGQTHPMAHPPPSDFLLAGGLDAQNLAARVAAMPPEARRRFRGVDAASRLEAVPGIKDPLKVTAFVRAVRALESA